MKIWDWTSPWSNVDKSSTKKTRRAKTEGSQDKQLSGSSNWSCHFGDDSPKRSLQTYLGFYEEKNIKT